MKKQEDEKQYFSKLHNEWRDLKPTDCEESLKKYGYEIRVKPENNIK